MKTKIDYECLRTLLSKPKYANKQLLECRNKMCSRTVTQKQWEEIRKIVGFIYFYSPMKISKLAEATLLEMTMREPYMVKFWRTK